MDRATLQPASAGTVTEIICISCWSSFEAPEKALEDPSSDVTCPHCGFAQPGPGPSSDGPPTDRDATSAPKTEPPPIPVAGGPPKAGSTSAPKDVPTDDPFAEMSHELGIEGADDPALGPPPIPVAEEPPWRVRTTTGLTLHFPDFDTAQRWAAGHEGGGLGIARGDEPLRHYAAFTEALQEHRDPVAAVEATPPAEGMAAASTSAAPGDAPQVPRKAATAAPKPSRSKAGAGGDKRAARTPGSVTARPESRRRSMSQKTGDFTFRTSKATSPWPGRLLFFGAGLLLGGGVVYYLSWLGVMPGIRY